MSRTTRRNKKYFIDRYLGTREELERNAQYLIDRYPDGLTFEQAYERNRARYTRDRHSGIHGKPNYWRRVNGVWKIRQHEQQSLHHHLRTDSWEEHLPENRQRRGYWY